MCCAGPDAWRLPCAASQRQEAVKRFRSDPSVRVAVLSITATAVGLDFSSASVVVFVELPHEVNRRTISNNNNY